MDAIEQVDVVLVSSESDAGRNAFKTRMFYTGGAVRTPLVSSAEVDATTQALRAVAALARATSVVCPTDVLLHRIATPLYSQSSPVRNGTDLAAALVALHSDSMPLSSTSKPVRRICHRVGTGCACSVFVPEVAWLDDGALWFASGEGVLREDTATVLYDGTWAAGMRHGRGRAFIYPCECTARSNAIATHLHLLQGTFDGAFVLGLRHGQGALTASDGSRYEGGWELDVRSGQGVESTQGGGFYRGAFAGGQRHGVGAFFWPPATTWASPSSGGAAPPPLATTTRVDLREYVHGQLHASRTVDTIATATLSQTATGATHPVTAAAEVHGAHAADAHTRDVTLNSLAAVSGLPLDSVIASIASAAVATATSAAQPRADGVTGAPSVGHAGDSASSHLGLQPLNAGAIRLLRHTSVDDISGAANSASVVTISITDSVETAITRMSESGVLSAPVYDATAGKFVALITMLDICAFMLDLVARKIITLATNGSLGCEWHSPYTIHSSA